MLISLLAVTPEQIRHYGLFFVLLIFPLLVALAIWANRRGTSESAAKGYELGKSLRERHPWIKVVDPIIAVVVALAAIYWLFIAKH